LILVFDTENNNLLRHVTTYHCAGAIDATTGEEYWFRPHQFKEFLAFIDSADTIVAHNSNGYDVPALEKISRISGFKWQPKASVRCTKVMSQVLNFNRFGFGHSLKKWGLFFEEENKVRLNKAIRMGNKAVADECRALIGTFYKGDYTGGFDEFSEEMFEYMKQDVRLGTLVYLYLMKELKRYLKVIQDNSMPRALTSETNMDYVMAKQSENGWLFDKEGAVDLQVVIEKKLREIENYVNPFLPPTIKVVDADTTIDNEKTTGKRYAVTKMPTYTKAGKLAAYTSRWFGIPDDTTVDTSPFFRESGGFCRIEFTDGDIGNTATVKQHLTSIGWKPDEWNFKRIDGKFVKVSAKLSDTSLQPLGDMGKALMDYYTLRSRNSIISGWFDHIDDKGRLHGDVFNIGTPTYRQTHKIIANLPSGKAVLGREFRSLFITPEGTKLVSADSAACQLRLLAHFMGDPDFMREVLEGDIHQKNADILSAIVGQTISRADAKPFIFAFLYGAGGAKLASILGISEKIGAKLKKKFQEAYPLLDELIKATQDEAEISGFIVGLDGRPIYCDSKHKALNYLIQGAEAVVMKYTVLEIEKQFELQNVDNKILLFYHDEVTYEVVEEQAEFAKEIIMKAFVEAPKAVGVDIMTCGDCKIGIDYFDVH
jgi:hypothetical protein